LHAAAQVVQQVDPGDQAEESLAIDHDRDLAMIRRPIRSASRMLWQVPEDRVSPGKIIHTLGWPADNDTYAGREPAGFDARLRDSVAMTELRKVRNIKPGFKKGLRLGLANTAWETVTGGL
jgi:hypothetical protein